MEDRATLRSQAGRILGITLALVTVLTGGLAIDWCVALLLRIV